MAELSNFTSTAVSRCSKNTELKIPIQTGLFLLPATRWWREGVEGAVGGLINMPVKKKKKTVVNCSHIIRKRGKFGGHSQDDLSDILL